MPRRRRPTPSRTMKARRSCSDRRPTTQPKHTGTTGFRSSFLSRTPVLLWRCCQVPRHPTALPAQTLAPPTHIDPLRPLSAWGHPPRSPLLTAAFHSSLCPCRFCWRLSRRESYCLLRAVCSCRISRCRLQSRQCWPRSERPSTLVSLSGRCSYFANGSRSHGLCCCE